jgi:hypothetical protein
MQHDLVGGSIPGIAASEWDKELTLTAAVRSSGSFSEQFDQSGAVRVQADWCA